MTLLSAKKPKLETLNPTYCGRRGARSVSRTESTTPNRHDGPGPESEFSNDPKIVFARILKAIAGN
jgi:hypothetical protein